MDVKMVIEYKGFRFEKYEKSATVNIYKENEEHAFNCFTHYEIGTDTEKFKESCNEWYEEILRVYY